MTREGAAAQTVNILIVAQAGRLSYEAVLFAASFKARGGTGFRLVVAEPAPGPLWPEDPGIRQPEIRSLLEELGAQMRSFESRHFGAAYPYGNKIEALEVLPEGEPFVFFDTDTLVLDRLDRVPFDFDRPTASLRREGTWPQIELYGPGYTQIWTSLYDRFGLDFASSLDLTQPDEYWQRYLYFNAGFFFYRCPRVFGQRFRDYALSVRDDPPPELACQSLDPWLDQVVLPLVIHGLGGGRDTLPAGLLDGEVTCHYRLLPLLYAREGDKVVDVLEEVAAPNRIKKVLKGHEPFKRMIYQGRGQKVRALFDRENLPRKEQAIRNRIKREGFWMR
ncbi:hypothetical protein PVW46_04945 [Mameliella sp. AT18]|uniref:hypothetical protein n=1 Tax=Mameliella sp. AT18 TaxID=3028385 RepID=UPI00084117FE|nr:hypothetical protein [Mameliella sp. AT18]MDD9729247.1 hypothetical protein [Mameliella sp. AT18]ODM47506.1 hypothetical protein A9320_04095 [Ruegeria sp. PBVC088]